MALFKWWVPAAALLMLGEVDAEHLGAENMNLLHSHEHHLVLNRGITGTCMYTSFYFQFTVSEKIFLNKFVGNIPGLSDFLPILMHLITHFYVK